MAKQKQNEKEVVTVNEFGVPLFIDKSSKTALRERVRLLKQVVSTGKPIGAKRALSKKDLERVEMHIKWYSAELRKLNEKKSSKKSA